MVLLGPALAILTIALVRWIDPYRNVKDFANALMAFNSLWISFWVPNAKMASIMIGVARDSISRFKSEVSPDGGRTDYDYKKEYVDPASVAANAGFRPILVWVKRSAK